MHCPGCGQEIPTPPEEIQGNTIFAGFGVCSFCGTVITVEKNPDGDWYARESTEDEFERMIESPMARTTYLAILHGIDHREGTTACTH